MDKEIKVTSRIANGTAEENLKRLQELILGPTDPEADGVGECEMCHELLPAKRLSALVLMYGSKSMGDFNLCLDCYSKLRQVVGFLNGRVLK